VGAVIDLLSSCSGQVLLAHMDPEEREALLRSIPRPWSIARPRLKSILEKVAKRGFELHKSPMTAGVTDISCPIRALDGKVVAALTIPYLHVFDRSLPTTVDQTRKLLEETTRRISQSLGWAR
jgi:DNA-binding IclR family transcriptional regulator